MKRIASLATGLLFLSFVFIAGAYAQDAAPKMIRGGVLNGKAIKLPKPAYPAQAMLDNARGTVSVTVTIDEEGNVIEAKALTGSKIGEDGPLGMGTTQAHPALCEAAEKAAMEAKFAPTKLSGQPIKVTGTIVYNFALGGAQPGFEVVNRGRAVLNSRATSLPEPVYPAAALAVKASGIVQVQVTVDEAGVVISAEAVSGHPLLRSAAVDAARLATFAPTLSDGQPVRFSGVLTYEFSPDGIKSVSKNGAEKPINGGVLNGKAIKLPAPAYPEAAKLENAGGSVPVTVTIDEEGNVIEAKAATEITITADDNSSMESKPIHPALQEAAEKAALLAKFSPTKLSGQPVKVTGTITYNFVAGGGSVRVPGGPQMRGGGIVNGKAIILPKPVYPTAAAEAGVTGVVNIQVTIDETGNVSSATAASGHPLLRAVAVEAAREAKFSPTVLSGQPVKVTGILTYYFKADGEWYTGNPAPAQTIDGGVLNGKATSLPMPAYPPAARAVRAGGAVSVHVVIDEQGNVVTARAVSGNPLLRAASVAAAQEAKFSPTLLEGKPVTVSGTLVYNFEP